MNPLDLAIQLDRDRVETLYLQISTAIIEGIRKGRFRPGDPLPGTRVLAEQLGVNRNTALAAYRELAAEGWVVSEPDTGTFVAEHPPLDPDQGASVAAADSGSWVSPTPMTEPFFQPPAVDRNGFQLLPDLPDVRLAPTGGIHRAYGRVLRLQHQRALQATWDPRGHLQLRASLCQLLRELRGIALEPGNLVLTRGLMGTFHVAAKGLFLPGEGVVVESPGVFRLVEAFRSAGARLIPVPVGAQGMDLEALEEILIRDSPRLICVTTSPQVPTHAVMPPAGRSRLLELARTHGAKILELDPDLGFHQAPSVALAGEDSSGLVFYLATLDQILAPGLQVGFIAGPAPEIKAMAKYRQLIDWPGNQLQEATLEELFRDGEIQRHLRRLRKTTEERREGMVHSLRRHLGPWVEVRDPGEGLALWVGVREPELLDAWVDCCAARGVVFYPGQLYEFHRRPLPFVCLGFVAHDLEEQNLACQRMAEALAEVKARAMAGNGRNLLEHAVRL